MKHFIKRSALLILCAVMLLVMLPNAVGAAEVTSGTCGENLTWTIEDLVLTISGTGVLNQSFDTYNCPEEFTSVVINEGITGIGTGVFSDRSDIKTVSLPSTLKTIGVSAFAKCFSLREIVIPEGVTSIGGSAFWQCSKLRSVTLPSTLETLGGGAFANCSVLREITIPNGVKEIGVSTFERCEALTTVTLPDTMISIGKWAFNHCSALKSITIPEGITVLTESLFASCENLKTVSLPSTLTTIETYAFNNCERLQEIVVPEGVTTIGDGAFAQCYALRSIELPDTLQTIGYQAFYTCESLTEIAIPDSVTSVGEQAFNGCSSLTKVKLSASMNKISGFYMCTALREVEIPEGVKIIDESAFSNCSSLTNITLPSTLIELGDGAFQACTSLKSISIPEGVDTINSTVFCGCSSLETVELPDTLVCIDSRAFMWCDSLKELTIPEGVLEIGESAFSGCEALISVDLPDSLEMLGEAAFIGCDALKEIVIPKGLETIDEDTFRDCDALETVTMYGALKNIEQNAFRSCDALKSITIPDGVEHITYSVFRECYSLETVEIADSVVELNGGTFQDCVSLKNITLSSSLKTIGDSLFKNCSSLKTLTIPEGVTTIEPQAFRDCSALKNLKLPTTLVSLGGGMIAGCDSLDNLLLHPNATAMNMYHEWDSGSYSHSYYDPLCSGGSSEQGEYSYGVTLYVYADSYPLTYAMNNNIPYVVVDETFDGHFHEYESVVTAPTCTEKGYTTYTCAVCGDSYMDTYVDAPGHNMGDWASYENGLERRDCENCDHFETREVEVEVEPVKPETPSLTVSGDSMSGKPKLKWNKVQGAEEYQIYRKIGKNGTYKKLATVTGTSHIDQTAEAGVKYYYRIRAVAADGTKSDYCSGKARTCDLAKPVVAESNVSSSGAIKLEWEKIEGAKEYKIYRRVGKSGDYAYYKTTTATAYTDNDTTPGIVYYYKVKAIHSNSSANSANSSAVGQTCHLPRPVVEESNVSSSGKIKLEWEKIEGAEEYTIYRATSKSGTYKKIATTESTSYTDKTAVAGKVYYYKVKAIHDNTSANSAYSSVVSQTCKLERPDVSIKLSSGDPKLTWDEVDGAKEYKVYRATSKSGTYKLVKTTTSEKFTDKSVTAGKTYYYKVKAIHSNSNANSAYSSIDSIKAK